MDFKLCYPYSESVGTADLTDNYNNTLVYKLYEFITLKNIKYTMFVKNYVDPATNEKVLEISFESQNLDSGKYNTDRTCSNDSIRVYGTVCCIAEKEMRENYPDIFKYEIKNTDDKKSKFQKNLGILRTFKFSKEFSALDYKLINTEHDQEFTVYCFKNTKKSI